MTRHATDLTTTPGIPGSGPLGPVGERLAVGHLADDDGLEVVLRNWRLGTGEVRGELDAVALDHAARAVVVVEVKARRSDRHGGPLVAVTPRKQAKVRSLTAAMLREGDLPYRRVRFDVVGLWLPRAAHGRLEHLLGAF